MGLLDRMIDTAAKKVLIDAAGEAVLKTARVAMEHEGVCVTRPSVKVPKSADSFIDLSYEEVEEELRAHGFVNIVLFAKKDLIKGWMTKVGAVEEVSIAGKTNFRKGQKFPADSRIVITYHALRRSSP